MGALGRGGGDGDKVHIQQSDGKTRAPFREEWVTFGPQKSPLDLRLPLFDLSKIRTGEWGG